MSEMELKASEVDSIELTAAEDEQLTAIATDGRAADSALRVALEYHAEVAKSLRGRVDNLWAVLAERSGVDLRSVPWHFVEVDGKSFATRVVPQPQG